MQSKDETSIFCGPIVRQVLNDPKYRTALEPSVPMKRVFVVGSVGVSTVGWSWVSSQNWNFSVRYSSALPGGRQQ